MKITQKSQKNEIQNLIRGAIGSVKSTTGPRTKVLGSQADDWKKEQVAYQQINKALDKAKKVVSPEEYQELNKWVQTNLSGIIKIGEKLGCRLSSLGLLPLDINTKSLDLELNIISDRVNLKFDELSDFCGEICNLQEHFLHEDWQGLRGGIDAVLEKHDYSYWVLEELLACEQKLNGLEVMKSCVSDLIKGSSGVNKFVLYQIGVRNEPAQSPTRFKDNLRKSIDANKLIKGLKAYFKFRLLGDIPKNEKSLAEVLSAEQLTTDIDVFFTSIKISLFIKRNQSFFSEKVELANDNLLNQLMPLLEKLGLNQELQFNVDLAKEFEQGKKNSTNNLQIAATAINSIFCDEYRQALQSKLPITAAKITNGIISQLSTSEDGVDADFTHKLLLNHNCYPLIIQLGDFSKLDKLPRFFLNEMSGSDAVGSQISEPLSIIISKLISMVVKSEYNLMCDHKAGMQAIIKAINEFSDGNFDESLRILTRIEGSDLGKLWSDIYLVLTAQVHSEKGDISLALAFSVDAYFKNTNLFSLLPISKILSGLKWKDISRFDQSLELSVALDLYLKEHEDSQFKNFKRYCVQFLIKNTNNESVADLFDYFLSSKKSNDAIIYFFDKVCDLSTIELLKGVEKTEQSQRLRLRNLQNLLKIDSQEAKLFKAEIKHIEHTLSIKEGMQVLDAGKVYVDKARLLNKLSKELSSDFLRYMSLVDSGIGVSESFSEILKAFKKPTTKMFQIPKSEADDLLFSMISLIRDAFLFDPAHGLDIYLSRRIRHGEIAGLIRGPLEMESLIAQKPTAQDDYMPPQFIESLARSLERKQKARVYGVVSQFSELIDQVIFSLRDDVFHIKSEEKPKGIFRLEISAFTFHYARNRAQKALNVDEFILYVIDFLWHLLAATLHGDKATFERDTAKKLNSIFLKLNQDMRACNLKDETLFSKIQRTSEEIRNKISILSSWIAVPTFTSDKKYKVVNTVDVEIARAISQQHSFKPTVLTNVRNKVEVNLSDFGLVSDTLKIAFQNIYEHSGKLDNKVQISINYVTEKSLLEFSILSEVSPNVKVTEREEKLKSIREKIAKGEWSGARKDKNSGLIKIAANLGEDGKDRIKFEFIENSYFLLEYALSISGTLTNEPDELIEHNLQ